MLQWPYVVHKSWDIYYLVLNRKSWLTCFKCSTIFLTLSFPNILKMVTKCSQIWLLLLSPVSQNWCYFLLEKKKKKEKPPIWPPRLTLCGIIGNTYLVFASTIFPFPLFSPTHFFHLAILELYPFLIKL